MSEHTGIAFREGAYLPVEDLSISVLDPAFSCSDVVFDAVSVTDGAFFRLDDHMARFRASCDHVYMTSPYSDAEMMHIMAQCVDRAGLSDALVLALCTRGRFSDGRAKGDPRLCENEFIAYAVPYYTTVPESCAQNGVHLWVAETRRAPNAAIDQRAKNFNRMDLTRAQFEALNAGADAPLLCSTEGYIAEGPGFNLWLLRGREALTPRDNLLEGITRKTVFELCTEAGLEAKATDLMPADLDDADEMFICSSAGGLMPVTRLNDKPIGNGAPGMTTSQLRDLYWQKRAEGWYTTAVADLVELSPAAHAVAE